ncbi:MAG: exo-alpha-sialidase [Armatimonadota bacterium]|jgi:hypothetical protein
MHDSLRDLTALAVPLLGAAACLAADAPGKAEIVDLRKIWDKAPHNAFTDLVRFKGQWYCCFREGQKHVSPDGALRVLASPDGAEWTSVAHMTSETADLRDAKVTITPDDQLMLSGAAAVHQPADIRHQTYVWFSTDGREWSDPVKIGEPDFWLWRVTWRNGVAYGIGYHTGGEPRMIRLYTSQDGRSFDTLVERLHDVGRPSETSLVPLVRNRLLCLLRRDGDPNTALFGVSRPPYTEWTWKDLGVRIGGPHMLLLPDGRLVAAGRSYEGGARTRLWWLEGKTGTLEEILTLPSGGDTSYPGLVFHDGLLWVSYYASHEGKTSIYLAKIKLPPA